MSDRKRPWWLLYLTPSAVIFLFPVVVIVVGVIVAILLPLISRMTR